MRSFNVLNLRFICANSLVYLLNITNSDMYLTINQYIKLQIDITSFNICLYFDKWLISVMLLKSFRNSGLALILIIKFPIIRWYRFDSKINH